MFINPVVNSIKLENIDNNIGFILIYFIIKLIIIVKIIKFPKMIIEVFIPFKIDDLIIEKKSFLFCEIYKVFIVFSFLKYKPINILFNKQNNYIIIPIL